MTERWLWWVKRDARVHDNEALVFLDDPQREGTAVFLFEPSLGQAAETSAFHALAMGEALASLQANLQRCGASLMFANGEAVAVLDALHSAVRFTGIVSHEETGTWVTFERDKAVARWARQRGVQWREFAQNGVVRGLTNRDERQAVIWQRLFDTPLFAPPRKLRAWQLDERERDALAQVTTERLPSTDELTRWSADEVMPVYPTPDRSLTQGRQVVSETAGRAELADFLDQRGVRYSGGISSPNRAFVAGSRLSTHLAWGTVSLRTAFHQTLERTQQLEREHSAATAQWKKSLRAFQARLHWHDHFIQRLESAPSMEFTALNPAYANVQYLSDGEELQARLQAWRFGQTGIPLLDACMRCLMSTGFLNFRMRAMLVTTACFGLQIPWRELIYPLAQVFADYEPGIHVSQIQMQAGVVGINTLRVYSPHKQLLDQDPGARFVRRWVPELSTFSAREIAGYEVASLGDYVRPITDITANAKHIKDQLYAIRRSDEGKAAAANTLERHGSRLSPNDRIGSPRRQGRRRKASDVEDVQMSFKW